VHADDRAARSARAVDALAYTVGHSVVFGANQYAPGDRRGNRLIAHELAHVVQQRGGVRRLQRACGPAAIGPTPKGCTLASAVPSGTRFLFDVGCDDFAAGELSRLAGFIATIPATSSITILGIASSEGPASFNESLACHRAAAGEAAVRAAGRGASISAVLAVGPLGPPHDPTFRAVDIIVTHAPPPPTPGPTPTPGPMSCPSVTVVPGSSTPRSVGSRGGCAGGPDFTFLDFPVLTTTFARVGVVPFRAMPTMLLEGTMAGELGTLGGAIGTGMFRNFAAGTGAPIVHGLGSPLSTAVAGSPTMRTAATAAEAEVQAQVLAMAGLCAVDWRTITLLPAPGLPALSFSILRGDTLQLNAVLGGTQGLTVSIIGFTVPPGGRTYTAILRWEICDDFGVDESDLDPTSMHGSPGLFSFWVLQHERAGHVPFVNTVIVDTPISGSF
jgi:hypothetical protein